MNEELIFFLSIELQS